MKFLDKEEEFIPSEIEKDIEISGKGTDFTDVKESRSYHRIYIKTKQKEDIEIIKLNYSIGTWKKSIEPEVMIELYKKGDWKIEGAGNLIHVILNNYPVKSIQLDEMMVNKDAQKLYKNIKANIFNFKDAENIIFLFNSDTFHEYKDKLDDKEKKEEQWSNAEELFWRLSDEDAEKKFKDILKTTREKENIKHEDIPYTIEDRIKEEDVSWV
ncbi:MAG: hypothetical protein LBD41_02640 [Clostridiales Family XIII bacterium]|nr:hypothetical protein [Clostridiales Family XIII bacterium]